ncbi:helix-turn-helix domain-containing protein [Sphingosinicella sp.]|uniref:helix-turn-helix domain-containing protein n=1 Tax=Sphingosinicella sp. TaxID=1917971 RepID=UPI00183176BB|nr:helix-turn-helix domain-containing protein [Sphingosinicella sp.]MBA4757745.1 helix-turn-helix domain-containing protein [Sphingosinicella sp.]
MEQIAVTVDEAKRQLCVGTTRLYQLVNSGELDSVRLGKRRLIKVASIRRLLGEEAA